MNHLFDRWAEVSRGLRNPLLLFDYDGTLTPIVSRPELAVLSTEMKELLMLASKRYRLGIISGRSLHDVRKFVGLRGIYYAGNHGFEVRGPGVNLVKSEAREVRPFLSELCRKLRKELAPIRGVLIEDKGLTVSLHYRLVPREDVGKVKKTLRETAEPYLRSGHLRITHGKKVLEIRPNIDWDKGKAVLWLWRVLDPKRELKPVYVGDDRTDEDAFIALKEKGITILVSRRWKNSAAKFFVRNVSEVGEFIRRLLQARPPTTAK